MPTILVTGASGNAGRKVRAALVREGFAVRCAMRSPDAPDAVAFDFEQRETWLPALSGVDALFLLRPPALSDMRSTLIPFVDAARAAGVGHVVFLSVIGAGRNLLVPHHAVERHLERGAQPYTLLRCGFFAQNCEDAYRRDIDEDSRVYVPAGNGHVAFVDLADVADAACAAFRGPTAHGRNAYDLTGPRALTFTEAASELSAAVGRSIRYEPASALGYFEHLRRRGATRTQAVVQTLLHVGLRWEQARRVAPDLPALLGRPPRSFADYAQQNRERFARGKGGPALTTA